MTEASRDRKELMARFWTLNPHAIRNDWTTSLLEEEDIRDIRRRCANGEKQRVVGEDYGITQTAVSKIVLRKTARSVE